MRKRYHKQPPSYRIIPNLVHGAAVSLGIGVFVILAYAVYQHENFWFDVPILSFFAAHQTDVFTYFFLIVTSLGSDIVLFPLGIVIFGFLLRYAYYLEAILLSVGFSGAGFINHKIKFFIHRERPDLFPPLQKYTGFSFPSGHTSEITAFALCLFLIISRIWPWPHWRWPVTIFLSALVILVASSRLYLQAHYPSDVLGGFLVALIWVFSLDTLIQVIFKLKYQNRRGEE
ncbi:PA-phosphatase-like phosphoesterase [Candidatus Nitrosoglobus terrae]|uniref:undecaprenyl-diphosphate phosphatase n=1 Tax=Candidatus Nitrosoglobus terrae TaxID=1630141 RepID=A0A1Q2SMH0_9GAMM|nr:phosphatase PAP2 family protein [Candidatus Nitrosoglobus terrae]BAW80345.1 PA-phosphatase-like phosphoesterase [Candidatus Nitrosoglobus terrae]